MESFTKKPDRKIVTDDGREFFGYSFGADGEKALELVFNTSSAGYQEILSDPSYTDQAVILTYPLIGNYGIAEDDFEARDPGAGAMIVREYNPEPSHCRSAASLGEVMKNSGVIGISGVDTRELTRLIRDKGTQRAFITGAGTPVKKALAALKEDPPRDAVKRVSRRNAEFFGKEKARLKVALIDCGVKKSIVDNLAASGCRVAVLPWNTPCEEILALKPDGVLVSNGPGDPADVPETIKAVAGLLGKVPLFGICLGHQILSLAYGAKTYKLKFGHRGGNHPVMEIGSRKKIEITSQNHSYAVDGKSLIGTPLEVTHVNLLDSTVEGVKSVRDRAFGVQFHPEGAPGPHDGEYLFDRFVRMMKENKRHA
ncbi:MAG: glutamine-hydrolyzing carbamoyl-phosphate synthase small subunit [Clostridia bacterium]|nr:glutamine-hydrolyzing carbamoyl-phosphate synthase small subunit [Clostridia bacterium]